MRRWLIAPAAALLLLPAMVMGQGDCPAGIQGADCDLYQQAAAALTSADGFSADLSVSVSNDFMGVFGITVEGQGTVRATVSGDGADSLELLIPNLTVGMTGMMTGTPTNASFGLILSDGTLYLGTGPSGAAADEMTWQSLPASAPTIPLAGSFPTTFFANSPNTMAAWSREADTTTLPDGRTAIIFSASATDQLTGLEAMSALGSGLSGSGQADLSALQNNPQISGMLGGMMAGLDSATATSENYAAVLVTESGEPAGFGILQNVTADLAGMLGGLTGGADTGGMDLSGLLGGAGMGLTSNLQLLVNITDLSAGGPITAPANATAAQASSDVTSLSGLLAGGLQPGLIALAQTLAAPATGPNIDPNSVPTPGVISMAVINEAGTIELGQTVDGTLAEGTQDAWTFTGDAGIAVIIAMNGEFDTYLDLSDADGVVLASNDDFDGLNSRIGPFTLPADGTYTILARSFGDFSSGAYTLSLAEAEAPETIAIAYGDSVDGTRVANADNFFTFTGRAGDVVTIAMNSPDFDTLLELLDASGASLTENDDFNDLNAQITEFELPADGAYTIRASSFSSSSAGDFTLALDSDAAPAPTPTASASTSGSGQWATTAEASSQYSDNSWNAEQTTGEPDTPECGDFGTAWASASPNERATLTVGFANPVVPTAVNIYQTYNPGSIASISLVTAGGETIRVPDSADPVGNTPCPGVFSVDVTGLTDQLVNGVVIVVDQKSTGEWNEIDAVELVGE